MDAVELIGWAAAAMTFAAYSMRIMLPLRVAAISANLLFIVYGALTGLMPVLVLHVVLFPLNIWRLLQIVAASRKLRDADPAGGFPAELAAYLKPLTVAPGTVLFRRGDAADSIYYLKSGRILLEEIGTEMTAGEIFGEVAFFSPNRTRLLTARCIGACELATMSETEFTRLYYQNPAFGFFILRLLASRLEENAARHTGTSPASTEAQTRSG